jgi:ribosomal protein L19
MRQIEQVIRTFSLSELFIIVGESIKIFYWNRHKNKKRIYSFFGMVLSIKKKSSYQLMNTFNSELISFKFPSFSPAILKPIKMFIYKQHFFRINKMKFLKKVFLKVDIFENTHTLNSSIFS